MRNVTFALLCLIAAGCSQSSRDIAISDLFGTYEMKSTGQSDIVEIRRDGSYLHKVVRSGKTSTQEGTWVVQRDDKMLWIAMADFDTSSWPEELPGSGGVVKYSALVRVEKNRIGLIVSSDLGYVYERTK